MEENVGHTFCDINEKMSLDTNTRAVEVMISN